MALPYMPLYVGDYLRDTARLKATHHGAYLLLMMDMWNHDGLLTDQPAIMASIARVDPKHWARVWKKLEPLFYKVDGGWRQKRVQIEYEKAVLKSTKRAAAGRLGGERKALKSNQTRQAIAKANATPSASNSSSKRGSMPEPEPYKASYASSGERAQRSIYDRVYDVLGPSVADPETCSHEAAVDQWIALGAPEQIIVDTVRLVTAFQRDRPIRKLHAITPEIRKSLEAQQTAAQNSELSELPYAEPVPLETEGDDPKAKAIRAIVLRKGEAWARQWLADVEWNGTEVYAPNDYVRSRLDTEVGYEILSEGYEAIVVKGSGARA